MLEKTFVHFHKGNQFKLITLEDWLTVTTPLIYTIKINTKPT